NPWLAALESKTCHLSLFEDLHKPIAPHPEGNAAADDNQAPGPFALAIGRMARSECYKGHEELIRIWPKVERARPGFRLVMLGDGDDRPRLQELARRAGAGV